MTIGDRTLAGSMASTLGELERAPPKTPSFVLGGFFAPTFAHKNLGRHPVFLRFLEVDKIL
jgi:hypothetical protein